MSVYSNKAHNKWDWDEPASSALSLCLLASSSGLGFDRSAPRIRRLHLMLYAHASFRQRYSDMSCQSPKQCYLQDFFRPSSGTFPLVKGSIPGRREREGEGQVRDHRDRAGAWQERYRKAYNRRLAKRSKKIVKAQGIHHEGKCSSGSYQFKGKTG